MLHLRVCNNVRPTHVKYRYVMNQNDYFPVLVTETSYDIPSNIVSLRYHYNST